MGKFGVIQKWCSILVWTHEILARGVPLFWSTYTHTHDRLDKLRSALAEAQLKSVSSIETFLVSFMRSTVDLFFHNEDKLLGSKVIYGD